MSSFGCPPSALQLLLVAAFFLSLRYTGSAMYKRNQVFAAACLGMLLFGIVFLSLGSVSNMLAQRFHLDNKQIGTLMALLPLGILVGSLVFGPVVDRFGYRGLLICCAAIVMAGLEGLALSKSHSMVRLFVFFDRIRRRLFEWRDKCAGCGRERR